MTDSARRGATPNRSRIPDRPSSWSSTRVVRAIGDSVASASRVSCGHLSLRGFGNFLSRGVVQQFGGDLTRDWRRDRLVVRVIVRADQLKD